MQVRWFDVYGNCIQEGFNQGEVNYPFWPIKHWSKSHSPLRKTNDYYEVNSFWSNAFEPCNLVKKSKKCHELYGINVNTKTQKEAKGDDNEVRIILAMKMKLMKQAYYNQFIR